MNYESLARTHVDPEPLEFSLRFAKLVATGLWPVRVTLLEQTARMAAATAGMSPSQQSDSRVRDQNLREFPDFVKDVVQRRRRDPDHVRLAKIAFHTRGHQFFM